MKRILPLLAAVVAGFLVFPLTANDQYNDGANWASQNKGQGSGAVSGFDPAGALPGYTASPPESGYYGGVTSPGVDLTGPGTSVMNTSDVGKIITESILNTPPDNKPSMDAPFIAEGLAMKDKAETITGGDLRAVWINPPVLPKSQHTSVCGTRRWSSIVPEQPR
nr:conjugal transfer protein TraN [Serratia proteamaculans]